MCAYVYVCVSCVLVLCVSVYVCMFIEQTKSLLFKRKEFDIFIKFRNELCEFTSFRPKIRLKNPGGKYLQGRKILAVRWGLWYWLPWGKLIIGMSCFREPDSTTCTVRHSHSFGRHILLFFGSLFMWLPLFYDSLPLALSFCLFATHQGRKKKFCRKSKKRKSKKPFKIPKTKFKNWKAKIRKSKAKNFSIRTKFGWWQISKAFEHKRHSHIGQFVRGTSDIFISTVAVEDGLPTFLVKY